MGRTAVIASLVGIVAFAAGTMAGMSFGGGGSPEIREVVRTTTVVVRTEPVAPKPSRTTAPRAAPTDAEPTPGDADLARRLVAEPAAPPPPAGDGRISGTVRMPDGSPAAGIEISAVASPASLQRNWWEVPAEEDLETRARRWVAGERRQDATRRRVVSDPDGRYELTGLADTTYALRCYLPDWNLLPTPADRAWKARPGDVIDFTAQPQALVPLRVVLPDGTEPEEASVQFQRGSYGDGTNWSPGQRTARTAPGTVKVSATAGASREWRSDVVEAEIPHHGAKEIVLTLRGRTGVTGVLRFAPGWDLTRGVRVGARRDGEPAESALEHRAGTDSTWPSADNGWRYAIHDLASGKWLLSVHMANLRGAAAEVPVEIGASLVRCDVDVPAPDRSKWVEVIALAPDGSPLKEATFTLQRRSARGSSSHGGSGMRRPEGTWWVAWPFDDEAPADAEYTVVVQSPEFGRSEASFRPGPQATAQVRFQVPAIVTATVTGQAGSELAGMLGLALDRVRAPGDRSPTSWSSTGVPADGRVKLEPAAPGDYDLVLVLTDGRHGGRPISRTRITLPPGEEVAATVAVPELLTLTVDLGAAGANARVEARPADAPRGPFNTSVQATANASGQAVLRRLPRGSWIVRRDREERTVEVTADTTLRW